MKSKKDIAIEEMLKYYDWPKCYVSDVINYCQLSSEDFVKNYNWYTQIFEHSFDLLTYTIDILNFTNKNNWKNHYLVQYILFSNSICYLYWTFDLMVRWLYTNSNLELRSYFETLIKIYFISWHPNKYSWIYWNNLRDKKDPKFNVVNFIEHKLKNNWKSIYSTLSLEAHWNTRKTLKDIKEYSTWKKKIRFDFGKDDLLIKYNQNILLMCLYASFCFINDILLKDYLISDAKINEKNIKYKFDEKIKTTITALKEILDDVDETKYNNLYKEVNSLMYKLKKEEWITK